MQTLNILRIFQMRSDERESPLGPYTSSTQLPLLQYSYVQILLKELVLLLNIYPLQLCINNRFSTAQPQHLQPGSLHKDTMDRLTKSSKDAAFLRDRGRQQTLKLNATKNSFLCMLSNSPWIGCCSLCLGCQYIQYLI